jgi:hypothetical protein
MGGWGDVIEQGIPIWMKMMILVYQKRMPEIMAI